MRGSDRVAHYGHISKEGSVWLRWVLCEAAQTAKRDPQFAAGFQRIAQRGYLGDKRLPGAMV